MPPDVFDGLTNLRQLNIGANELVSLPSGVFDGLKKLDHLYIYQNNLVSLPSDIFDGLTSLRFLKVVSNPLDSLRPDVFDNLNNLHTLVLYSNGLGSLPPGVFDNLNKLEELDIRYNGLTSLPPDVFEDLSALRSLDARSNPLVCIPLSAFGSRTDVSGISINPALCSTQCSSQVNTPCGQSNQLPCCPDSGLVCGDDGLCIQQEVCLSTGNSCGEGYGDCCDNHNCLIAEPLGTVGECVPCGSDRGICCANRDPPCDSDGFSCIVFLADTVGTCSDCGGENEECCSSNRCANGLICSGGRCNPDSRQDLTATGIDTPDPIRTRVSDCLASRCNHNGRQIGILINNDGDSVRDVTVYIQRSRGGSVHSRSYEQVTIRPGTNYVTHRIYWKKAPSGTYTISAFVDSQYIVDELNENNNRFNRTVELIRTDNR